MVYQLRNIKLHVEKDYEGISKVAADIIAEQIIKNPKSVLGLATGSTPVGTYKCLIEKYNDKKIDFKDITTFNLDEYYNLPKTNDQSYDYFMRDNLFNHVNVAKQNLHIPNGMAEDIEKECSEYDKSIESFNEIDIQILGIGDNGHIAFNEPSSKFEMNTHKVELTKETIESNSRFFKSIDEVPTHAVTTGIKNIMLSKRVILLANGKNKADAINKTLFGNVDPQVPASILQLHPNVDIIITEDIFDEIKENL